MAFSPFQRLLHYPLKTKSIGRSRLPFLILNARPFSLSRESSIRSNHFTTAASTAVAQSEAAKPNNPDAKTSLSARMSFVFDQLDAMEREKNEKDETLQRIRAWREKKQKTEEQVPDPGPSVAVSEEVEGARKRENLFATNKIEMVHPWPEWIEFIEQLVRQNYFDHQRKNEDQLLQELGCDDRSGFEEEGFDFTRDWITVRTACVNFGRDRFDILRSLSRKDIKILVGHGCPSTDTKVTFSAKVLRKYVLLDEGDVCSSCSLRASCNRAFLLCRKEDEARTVDVIRMLLSFGFDPIKGSVENRPLMQMKPVKTVVRKLLHEIVKLSSVPIDPNLPPPEIKRPPPKIKQPPPLPKKRVGRDDIEMKKGDWLCPKCDFMNFAKNTVCLQCDAKRPKRQLLPGEWECPECNFLNYRRNMVCFHCEHKRPPDEYMENQAQEKPRGPHFSSLHKASRIPGITDSYNFDFDDDESDGAEVSAFEFADPPKMGNDYLLDDQASSGRLEGNGLEDRRMERQQFGERDRYADHNPRSSASNHMGFRDFVDEEEDDVDSYEIDTSNDRNSKAKVSSRNFSESEEFSGSENDSCEYARPSRPVRNRDTVSVSDNHNLDFGSDEETSDHSWKSSHIADARPRARLGGRGPHTFSDDKLGLCSDSENEVGQGYTHKWDEGRKNRSHQSRGFTGSEDDLSFGSESDEDNLRTRNKKTRGNRTGPATRSHDWSSSSRDMRSRSSGTMDKWRNSLPRYDTDRSGGRGDRKGGHGEKRVYERGGFRGSDRPANRERFGSRPQREAANREQFGSRPQREGANRGRFGSRPQREGANRGRFGSRPQREGDDFYDTLGRGRGHDNVRPRRRVIER